MVINYNGVRMMLTIEFEEDKNQLTYLNLLDEIKRDFLHEK